MIKKTSLLIFTFLILRIGAQAQQLPINSLLNENSFENSVVHSINAERQPSFIPNYQTDDSFHPIDQSSNGGQFPDSQAGRYPTTKYVPIQSFGIGSNIDPQPRCFPPLQVINGICRCPNNGFYQNGFCQFGPQVRPNQDSILLLRSLNRSFDGTGNNPFNQYWGAKQTDLQRKSYAYYEDGLSKPFDNRPSPRLLSNAFGSINGTFPNNRQRLSMILPMWGQFIDHDITLTPEGNETMDIPIPFCDAKMDPKCTGTQRMEFKRSIFNPSSPVRSNVNVISAWIDGSQIYGCDKATADGLRAFYGGRMRTSEGNLLPRKANGVEFDSGDARVNENIGLTAFHTIFLREHNRLADELSQGHSELSDEDIYQIARHFVIALIQKITYDDFLPLMMGKTNFDKHIGRYTSYNSAANPNIRTEFSAAGYRLGHPLINAPFKLIDSQDRVVRSLELGEMFFNPKLLTSEVVEQLFRGFVKTPAKQRNLKVVEDLRNFLIPGTFDRDIKLDLYSFNIQRGRDHGLPPVNGIRKAYGMPALRSFRDIFPDLQLSNRFRTIYGSVENLDPWLAVIGEPSSLDGILGEFGSTIIGQQFKAIRDGDAFWYEKEFPSTVIQTIKSTSLEDIITRNTNIRSMPRGIFHTG